MKLNEICEAAEYFILGEEQCWFDHFVVIQSRNKYKAKFMLFGVSGMTEVAMQSVCGRYAPIVHSTDPDFEDRWDIVEVFHSRAEYFEYQARETEKANKEENGNGMRLFLVETFVKSKTSDYTHYDNTLFYFDECAGLWYEELFSYESSLRSNSHSIVALCSSETCVDEDGEDYYPQLKGAGALDEHYRKNYIGSSLADYFSETDYMVHDLGTL